MAETFRLHVLPGGNGDALVVEYGEAGQLHRVLVDGGVERSAAAVASFLGPSAVLDVLVVTHIDNDHIGGMLALLDGPEPPVPRDVWFNGFRHLPQAALEPMGPVAGERLTTLIVDREYPWNAAFGAKAVELPPAPAPAPVSTLSGGLRCTVLGPGPTELARLRREWIPVVQEAGLDPQVAPPVAPSEGAVIERMGPLDVDTLADRYTPTDGSVANGSSIALLMEFAQRRVLLTGDAHADVVLAGVDRLAGRGATMPVDVLKLPHHGSKANVTRELIERVPASVYVVSTDGSGNQRHPNDEAIARVVKYAQQPVIAFNFSSPRTSCWDNEALRQRWKYSTRYPSGQPGRISIDVLAEGRRP